MIVDELPLLHSCAYRCIEIDLLIDSSLTETVKETSTNKKHRMLLANRTTLLSGFSRSQSSSKLIQVYVRSSARFHGTGGKKSPDQDFQKCILSSSSLVYIICEKPKNSYITEVANETLKTRNRTQRNPKPLKLKDNRKEVPII